jgi:hypothetical protein
MADLFDAIRDAFLDETSGMKEITTRGAIKALQVRFPMHLGPELRGPRLLTSGDADVVLGGLRHDLSSTFGSHCRGKVGEQIICFVKVLFQSDLENRTSTLG